MREPEIDLPGLLDLILNALQGIVKETTSEFDRSDFEEQLHNLFRLLTVLTYDPKIVEPGVSVAKDLPQPKEDPYVAPASPKPANWARRHGAAAWKATKTSSARAWGQLKESGVATQVVLSVVGAGGGGRMSSDT